MKISRAMFWKEVNLSLSDRTPSVKQFEIYIISEIFIKLNLAILLVLVRRQEKSQKYVDLSSLNYNLNDSYP